MTASPQSAAERARKMAETAAVLALIAAILLLTTTLLSDLASPALRTLRDTEVEFDFQGLSVMTKIIGVASLTAGPSILIVCALFELHGVLQQYERGEFFTEKASAGLRATGEWFLGALAVKVLVAPTVLPYIEGEGRGFFLHFESFDFGLGAVALFIILMGRVLEAAAAIKAENDEIV